jgi:AbrB family looped-hinge helix DNA binding protein
MAIATLTSKGQMTLPKDIRERAGLQPGDKVKVFVDSRGDIRLLRMRSIKELAGVLHRPGMTPVTVEEMNDAVGEAVAERYLRSSPAATRPASVSE